MSAESGIKKIVNKKCPSIVVQKHAIEALSICAENFIELIVQATASYCEENQRSLIVPQHVLEGIKNMGFLSLLPQATEICNSITAKVKESQNSWKQLKLNEPNMTEEELAKLQEESYQEAVRFMNQNKK